MGITAKIKWQCLIFPIIFLTWLFPNDCIAQLVREKPASETIKEREKPLIEKSFEVSKWRVGFDPSQLIWGYKEMRSSVTFMIKDPARFINFNVGFGWESLNPGFPSNSRLLFESDYSSLELAIQYFKNSEEKENTDSYIGIGPLFRTINNQLGQGFFHSKKFKHSVVFDQAKMETTRYGLLPTVGIVLTRGHFNLDLRFEIPFLIENNQYTSLVEPFILNSFEPNARKFQKEGSHFVAYPILALFIGVKG